MRIFSIGGPAEDRVVAMIPLNVPFVPDESYAAFLREHAGHLDSCYLSLHGPVAGDARLRFDSVNLSRLSKLLARVPVPHKYALANTRFHDPSVYTDTAALRDLAGRLETLVDRAGLTGVVFGDAYFLNALSDASPRVCGLLHAVPSVNFLPDSGDKVRALADLVAGTAFLPPDKITVDRGLNRDPSGLREMAGQCGKILPGVRLEVLANEGCLYQCPYKPAHDAHISFANTGLAPDATHEANRLFGCMRVLVEKPHRMFASPLIRPEDVARYEGVADVVKVAGRTLGPEFLKRCVTAYMKGRYEGNLLDLTDSMDWLAAHYHVDNQGIPEDFADRLETCSRDCGACAYCEELFSRVAEKKPAPFAPRPARLACQR
ncbi:MAG: hypothetical protein ACLFOY_01460 [Desulfatibacillaceae bacterium]